MPRIKPSESAAMISRICFDRDEVKEILKREAVRQGLVDSPDELHYPIFRSDSVPSAKKYGVVSFETQANLLDRVEV